MKKKPYKKISLILMLLIFTSLTSCKNIDKEAVISNNVKEEVREEDKEIENNLQEGNQFLEEKKYNDAKKLYEKAISIDKVNKNIYVKIKDKYIEKERYDDAFYIIKLAIDNNVDVDNMKVIQKQIEEKFTAINVDKTVYINSVFSFPKEITFKLNNEEEISSIVEWNSTEVNTKNLGITRYDGYIKEYGRKVSLVISVIPSVTNKSIGYIKSIYEKGGIRYIDFDEVEFYRDEEALEQGLRDGKAFKDEKGQYFVTNSYYIRNSKELVKKYQVSNNSKQSLCEYQVDSTKSNVDLKEVSFGKFKEYISNSSEQDQHSRLFWIYTENDIVTKLEMQYTP